jgi:hypothetical protein
LATRKTLLVQLLQQLTSKSGSRNSASSNADAAAHPHAVQTTSRDGHHETRPSGCASTRCTNAGNTNAASTAAALSTNAGPLDQPFQSGITHSQPANSERADSPDGRTTTPAASSESEAASVAAAAIVDAPA